MGSRDMGSRDMGSRDMRSRDMRRRDMGSRDIRRRDMGSRDMGSRDMGVGRVVKEDNVFDLIFTIHYMNAHLMMPYNVLQDFSQRCP